MSKPSESTRRPSNAAGTFGTLRVALISHVPGLLDELGADGAMAARRAGIPADTLADGENAVAFEAVGRLIEEGVRATGLEHLGLLIGERFLPSVALGGVVDLMRNAPTVEVALRAFVLHHHLNDSGAVPMLLPLSGRRVALAYVIFGEGVPAIDAFYDAALAYGVKIMRMICGKAWQPSQVNVAHRRPVDAGPYTAMFGSAVRFDATASAIEFPAEHLAKPVAGADPGRYAHLLKEMRLKHVEERRSLADQVKRAFLPMILAGTATAPNIAKLFSVSERVMRLHLASEGRTVRMLLLQAKVELAAQLLRSTQLSVGEIGAAVGYCDPPSFVRAFKSHMAGMTPGAWRGDAH